MSIISQGSFWYESPWAVLWSLLMSLVFCRAALMKINKWVDDRRRLGRLMRDLQTVCDTIGRLHRRQAAALRPAMVRIKRLLSLTDYDDGGAAAREWTPMAAVWRHAGDAVDQRMYGGAHRFGAVFHSPDTAHAVDRFGQELDEGMAPPNGFIGQWNEAQLKWMDDNREELYEKALKTLGIPTVMQEVQPNAAMIEKTKENLNESSRI